MSLVCLSLLAGCSTYRTALGSYRSPADYSPATHTWRGPFHMSWPVTEVHVNRGFKPAEDRAHAGVDLGGRRGAPVFAAHEGRVVYAGNGFHGYGNMVLLEFDHEWATLYAHLDTLAVRNGQYVHAGDRLGGMGSTGRATGVHLHFEALHRRAPTDPLALLSRQTRVSVR